MFSHVVYAFFTNSALFADLIYAFSAKKRYRSFLKANDRKTNILMLGFHYGN